MDQKGDPFKFLLLKKKSKCSSTEAAKTREPWCNRVPVGHVEAGNWEPLWIHSHRGYSSKGFHHICCSFINVLCSFNKTILFPQQADCGSLLKLACLYFVVYRWVLQPDWWLKALMVIIITMIVTLCNVTEIFLIATVNNRTGSETNNHLWIFTFPCLSYRTLNH